MKNALKKISYIMIGISLISILGSLAIFSQTSNPFAINGFQFGTIFLFASSFLKGLLNNLF